MTTLIIQGGHQEDAEEFFGLYVHTLEEELLAILVAVSAPPIYSCKHEEERETWIAPPTPPRAPTRSRNRLCRMRMQMEMCGWRLGSGVGRLLRVRYVLFFSFLVLVLCRVFYCSFSSSFPSLLDYFLASFLHYPFTRLLTWHLPTHR